MVKKQGELNPCQEVDSFCKSELSYLDAVLLERKGYEDGVEKVRTLTAPSAYSEVSITWRPQSEDYTVEAVSSGGGSAGILWT